jgi:hypothetical protein
MALIGQRKAAGGKLSAVVARGVDRCTVIRKPDNLLA